MKKQQQMTSKKRAQNNTFQINQINSNHLQHNTKITILKQLTKFVALESTFKLHTIISYNHAINVFNTDIKTYPKCSSKILRMSFVFQPLEKPISHSQVRQGDEDINLIDPKLFRLS